MATEAIKIEWKDDTPRWVPQWPLTKEKLTAAKHLVEEQLKAGHLRESVSPWNTPIFVIKKKSGKWRLLHDLRRINSQMQIMGPIQLGLPVVTALPKDWPSIVIDIKDCFFSIPLHQDDTKRFAFTLPAINHTEPDRRYEWTVLPQGMANSPTMCQIYVSRALKPFRNAFPNVYCYHYMDDILICGNDAQTLPAALTYLQQQLAIWGLTISPEKIQMGNLKEYLGLQVSNSIVTPQRMHIRKDQLKTLNDFQKLLGDINWIRPYLKITTSELKPLFEILPGDPKLDSPRALTPNAIKALQLVENRLALTTADRCDLEKPVYAIVIPSPGSPTGVLWQGGPLQWIYLPHNLTRVITPYTTAVATVANKVLKASIRILGRLPDICVVPYDKNQLDILTNTVDDWAIVTTSYPVRFDNHYPSHPLIDFCKDTQLIWPKTCRLEPLAGATTIFTDGSKQGTGAYVINGQVTSVVVPANSAQRTELLMVIIVLQRFGDQPINIISDSKYAVAATRLIETAIISTNQSPISSLLTSLQEAVLARHAPFYIGHIRAHSEMPGSMAEGNKIADANAKFDFCGTIEEAREYHKKWHVNSLTLKTRFNISRADARDIVKGCGNCTVHLPTPSLGVNPKGLLPNHLWQMDVTHIPSFGQQQYLHLSVDTCSGIISATPLRGENAKNVMTHCLRSFACWGVPKNLKTDNAPAYTSKTLKSFLACYNIQHSTGIPYNPQGQGVVERAHLTFKTTLQKIKKGGIGEDYNTPKDLTNLVTFILNFLTLDKDGLSAAERHWGQQKKMQMMVKWKDILTGLWRGPDPVLRWHRGSLCVFPQDAPTPIWVPERLTRMVVMEPVDPVDDDDDKSTSQHQDNGGASSAVGSRESVAVPTAPDK